MDIKCKCHWCSKSIIRKKQGKPVKYHFCNNVCKGEYQRTAKPVSKEWLYEHYTTKKMNTTKIAKIVNRDPKSVWNWLKDFDIPTRGRGVACEHLFPKGHKLGVGRKHTPETRKKLSDIAKAEGRVPYDKNVGSYMKNRRGKDTPNWKGGITPERQSVYSSKEWSNAVKAVWHRDDATCQRCKIINNDNREVGFDIHHIVSFATKELRTVSDNLILLCKKCHYWVHSNKNINREFIKSCP